MNAPVLSSGGYLGTPSLIPHWPRPGQPLTPQQEADNTVHRRARARVKHAFSRMRTFAKSHPLGPGHVSRVGGSRASARRLRISAGISPNTSNTTAAAIATALNQLIAL